MHAHGAGRLSDHGPHIDVIALLHTGLAGRAHMLIHGKHDLWGQRQLFRGIIGRILVVRDTDSASAEQFFQSTEIHLRTSLLNCLLLPVSIIQQVIPIIFRAKRRTFPL